ncbi:unnamed protein product [Prunus brigantina]
MMRLFGVGLLIKRLWPRDELISAVRKNKLLRGRLLVLVLDPLNVVLSLVFIGGVLEGQSRLKKDLPDGLKISAWWSLIGASG